MWKGILRTGDERVPVKLYAAVDSRAPVRFRLLHEPDLEPLRRRLVNPETGDEVPFEESRRAYELDDGRLVVFDDDELEALEPDGSRDIELLRFLPAGTIGPGWYVRPYYLGPDDDDAGYGALVTALEKEKREGLARWTMRRKPYVGALRAQAGVLVLVTLRFAGEVVHASELEPPSGRKLTTQEIRMAEQLVGMLAGPFESDAYRDEYRERVLELAEAKRTGKAIRLRKPRKRPPEDRSLAETLRASLKAAEGRKSA
jgi:DNA end-binding protein Ku